MGSANFLTGPNRNGSQEDHVMAVRSTITPARINPSWTPATRPLGMLEPFFNGRGRPLAAAVSPAPRKPVPAMELA